MWNIFILSSTLCLKYFTDKITKYMIQAGDHRLGSLIQCVHDEEEILKYSLFFNKLSRRVAKPDLFVWLKASVPKLTERIEFSGKTDKYKDLTDDLTIGVESQSEEL